MKNSKGNINLTLVVALVVLVLSAKAFFAYGTDEYVTFTVTDKERIVNNTSEGTRSKYLVFTDKGTFENTDSLFYWKWNSSDLYGRIRKGETYKAHVYGFRVGFLSWYKNIVSVSPVLDAPEIQ